MQHPVSWLEVPTAPPPAAGRLAVTLGLAAAVWPLVWGFAPGADACYSAAGAAWLLGVVALVRFRTWGLGALAACSLVLGGHAVGELLRPDPAVTWYVGGLPDLTPPPFAAADDRFGDALPAALGALVAAASLLPFAGPVARRLAG